MAQIAVPAKMNRIDFLLSRDFHNNINVTSIVKQANSWAQVTRIQHDVVPFDTAFGAEAFSLNDPENPWHDCGKQNKNTQIWLGML